MKSFGKSSFITILSVLALMLVLVPTMAFAAESDGDSSEVTNVYMKDKPLT